MIKRIVFALFACVVLSVAAAAAVSPALDIIKKELSEKKVPSSVNYSPEAGEMSVDTLKGIAVFKSFLAADPDGDDLFFEIVKFPGHGSVEVIADGQFVYRPLSKYVGKDSFSYRAVDVYGNASETKTVQVLVSKPVIEVRFDDMKNHWAHNSAIKMASTGLMTGETEGGKLLFRPEEDMTRGDFLALSLIMAGHEKDIPFSSKTVFSDDDAIPSNIKSYVQYAYDKGIISGYDNGDGTVNFESTGSISRAEAALIVSRILGLDTNSDNVPSYKDVSSIPAWASNAVFTLSDAGIINGDAKGEFSAERRLTRAEGAEIICNVAEYADSIKTDTKKTERNLFNLFGLLG